MKIETSIPRDFTRVKEKIIFNLSKRQLVCFGLAASIGIPSYFLLKSIAGPTAAMLGMVAIMIPMFLFAMYEKLGQPLEVLVKNFVRTKFFRTRVRLYREKELKATEESKDKSITVKLQRWITKDSPKTAQETIPYLKMYHDGTCKVSEGYYSRSIVFSDRNYTLLKEEEKKLIFHDWGELLKLFGEEVRFQLSYMSLPIDWREQRKKLFIPYRPDGLNNLREEQSLMMYQNKRAGSKDLEEVRVLTFGIYESRLEQANEKLYAIEKQVMEHFEQMNVDAVSMSGIDRLRVMHRMMHLEDRESFYFDWNELSHKKKCTKDYIAPCFFYFNEAASFTMGETYVAVSYVSVLASKLNDEILKDIVKTDSVQIASIHAQVVEQVKAVKMVKNAITEIDCSKITEQKKAVRTGYDMDIIPENLNLYANDVRVLLKALENEDEKLFFVMFLLLNTGKSKRKLEEHYEASKRTVGQKNCELHRLNYLQEQGFVSSLPLANNQIDIRRVLTTSSTAVFMPFVSQELFHDTESAICYGMDQLTKKLIVADRKQLKVPNALIVGSSGSGKSFKTKKEILFVILKTKDDVIVCDPESEYRPLVEKLGGQVIRISAGSKDYINPLDINWNYSDGDSPLLMKSDFVLSLFELVLDGRRGIEPEERSAIDSCLPKIYKKYFEEPIPENMPILEDLYEELLKRGDIYAKRVAMAMEIYVTGSLNFFNHRTNVDLKNRLVCFDIKDLGTQMKKIGLLIVQDFVWGKITANRSVGKSTWYYADEFHLLLRDERTAAHAVEIWKRFRKYGGICTGITQDAKDFLVSSQVENIMENSDMVLMFNQGTGDRNLLQERFELSKEQLSYITGAKEGKGLIYYGGVILPFEDDYPKDSETYQLMTTKLSEVVPYEGK